MSHYTSCAYLQQGISAQVKMAGSTILTMAHNSLIASMFVFKEAVALHVIIQLMMYDCHLTHCKANWAFVIMPNGFTSKLLTQ